MAPFGLAALAAGQPAAADALALAQLVREAVAAEVPRQALHLQLSRLAPRMRRGHHRRLLREALEPALRPVRSRLFELPNGDLVAVAPPGGRHLREAEGVLAILLGEEAAEAPLHAVLELPRDAAALLAAVEDSLGPPPAPRPRPAPGAGFGPAELAALEAALRGAGLARFLRRRPVCRLARGGEGPVLEWEEWRLAWPELRAEMAPALDPAAAPWLARRPAPAAGPAPAGGTRPAGGGAAARAARPRLGGGEPGEVEFLRLDALLDATTRAATVLALPAEDALAAPGDFAFARDFARARGYRLALDLAGPELLAALPPDRVGVDLLRLPWSPGLAALAPALPAGRVVLTGADARRRSAGGGRPG
ncbi:hypothetical protein [Dankookia sp. P2]|uniref:hypothetical protein n=1 Tax=Dankookia sp. P2 TaxID=3423955 RepID=UPI003D674607